MVFPDDDWLLSLIDAGDAPSYDILPFRPYPETWENTTVEKYLVTQYYSYFQTAGWEPVAVCLR